MRRPRLPQLVTLTVLAVLCAAPAFAAYVIYLRDGSYVIAREKYRLEGNRAIITLENGTQTFLPATDVDAPRTEQYNKQYGGTVVIPGQPQKVGPETSAPKEKTLADLINSRAAAPRDLPVNRRDKPEATAPGRLVKTQAGFDDLTTLPRKPYGRIEVSTELQQFFRGQGFESVEIRQGTRGERPLIELTTPSEGTVLKALTTAANALLHIRGSHPQVAAFEIVMTTPERERAGQFVLTPNVATDLVSKKLDATAFFVQNVQF